MKLVIKDNKVLAAHDNNQEIESLYEDCSFVIDDNFSGQIGDEYVITEEQLNRIQSMKNITKRQLLIWIYIHKQKTEDDIYSAIDTITDEGKKYLAKVSYSGTNNFYYGNEFTQLIGLALGLTIGELKQCFNEASSL